jgi:two-component system, cell cycle response regulator DivK
VVSGQPPGEPPLVLVADDFDDVREMYAEFLEFAGFRVVQASTGLEAIEAARVHRPDVILMDVTMPDLDGFAATARLRQDPDFVTLPILMLTAHVFAEHEEQARAVGCSGFIRKPCLPDDLVREVRRVLASRQ